jgi:hypothetical protein
MSDPEDLFDGLDENVIVRCYIDGKLRFTDKSKVKAIDFEAMVNKHAAAAGDRPLMIEVEFLDQPEPQRFLRFGTDPRGMVMPMPLTGFDYPD